MIAKLHRIKSTTETKGTTVVCLPGGPGLSSVSFQKLISQKKSFDLILVDPPGTGDAEIIKEKPTYESLLNSIVSALKTVPEEFILCGHSFGGIQAAEIASQNQISNIVGLVCIASPFSENSYQIVRQQYQTHITPTLSDAEKTFNSAPTSETFKKWLASYGELYFYSANIESGAEMILNDKVSVETFLAASGEGPKRTNILSGLAQLSIPKLYLAGQNDNLVPVRAVENDLREGGFTLKVIKHSGHFVAFDNPEETIQEIRDFFN